MRGRKGKIGSPSGIISTAIFMGLVALVRITRNRTSRKTRRFYRSIEKMWTKARKTLETKKASGEVDFSSVQNAEPNMRGQFFKFVWTTTKRFGNRELKRIYSWLEGTVGPLNALFNYAGARLRELAMIYYPFPRPQAFQIREYPDGSKKILNRKDADRTLQKGAIKVYWRYGYERKGRGPRILLAHPTLPGLDFVEMIRAHCVELCRQCFIYDVSMTEAHRYIRLLIHRLMPFLDWVYTDGQEGRPNFNPRADHELRKIVLEIRSLHKKRSRIRKRISKRRGESTISLSLEEIRRKIIAQLERSTDSIEQKSLLKFLDYIETGLVADEDVEKTIGQVRENVTMQLKKSTNKVERESLQKMLDYVDLSSLDSRGITTPFEQIREKIVKQLRKTSNQTRRGYLLKLLDYLDINVGYILDRDVEKLTDQVLSLSRREGNVWHRILVSDLHHPVSLRQVVHSGDKMLDSLSSILVVAELPVAKRSGQVDLTIFIRRDVEGRVLWTPVMVLEIKTKTALDFNLYGLHIKRKRKSSVTPAFYAWKRTMSNDEWDAIITAGPNRDALQQLRNYENELLSEYGQIVPHDPTPPSSLWKGVIVLDTDQSPIEVSSAFQYLLEDLTTGLIRQLVKQDKSISVVPDSLNSQEEAPRVALLVTLSKGPDDLLEEMVSPRSIPNENPFIDREPDDRILTLYVSVPSPTSSGVTAARLSQNWHLLHHIQECIDTSSEPIEDVIWLDLMGVYTTHELVGKRFGLDTLLREKTISERAHRQLITTLRSIKFFDIGSNINELLEEEAESLDKLVHHIENIFPKKGVERIVIIDGWTELQGMVPGYRQSLLRTLEQRLLDALPQSKVNIIWIDSGVPQTRMNVHYQRKCINPLRHDSPRRTHLDEIIYNLPTTPLGFGWMTPQREDVRVIVQDTPTNAEPWKVAIHVPQLVGFAEKFRGLARRDRLVPPEDVEAYTTGVRPMYGRGVTLSSVHASTGRLSDQSFSEVLVAALTLVPGVLRSKEPTSSEDEEGEEPSSDRPLWQTAIETVSSGNRSTLGGRIVPDVTRPPPAPRRGVKRYTDVLTDPEMGITRRWYYELTPRQFPEDDDVSHVFSHPRAVKDAGAIDTIETREQELKRLYYATRHLKDQTFLAKKLRRCCERIERFCAKQFSLIRESPSMKSPEFFLGALIKVKELILEDPKRMEFWKALLPLRQGLLDLLNSENRLSIEEVMKRIPDVLLLYGNNLFLAVLAALEERSLSQAEHLWNSVAEWTFYQLGMNVQDTDSSRLVYSFQAILSNLRSRVKTLSQLGLPEKSLLQERVGAIIWKESEFGFDALLLIPHEDGFLTGLIKGLGDRWIPAKWNSCVTASQDLKEFSKEALTSMGRTALVMSIVGKTRVLWVPVMTEYDDETQWGSFSLVHGKPGGRWNSIPWLKLEQTVPLAPPSKIPAIPDSVDETLRKLVRVKHKTIPVEVTVSVNKDHVAYEVELEGDSLKERLEFSSTAELVRFLRSPIRQGKGYRSHGNTLTWDHRRDIDYDEGSLSFLRPLVHRSRFFPDEYHYPKTCKEFLASSTGKKVTMVILQEGSTYHVGFEDLPSDSLLRELEDVELDIYSLGLLAECRELFDSQHCMWHPVNLNVKAILDIRFSKIHEYPRLHEALQAADLHEFDWSRDTWYLSSRIHGNEVHWSINSETTGEPWMNLAPTFNLTPGIPPDTELETFRQVIGELVPLSHVSNLDDKLEILEATLIHRYQEHISSLKDVKEKAAGADPLVEEGPVYMYVGLAIRSENAHTGIVVSLKSEDGEETEEYVVDNVHRYVNDSQYAGAIYEERVDTEVTESLADYKVEDDELEKIRDEVKQALEEMGVRFYEV